MYKLKQLIVGIFISTMILVTSAAAAPGQTVHGTVTLPTSITDLLNTCSGAACPSINIAPVEATGSWYSWSGGSVDFNDTTGQYEYSMEVFTQSNQNVDYGSFKFEIEIRHGDMGYEILVYNPGSDNAIGTTGDIDTIDSIVHADELSYDYTYGSYVVPPLILNSLDTQLDFDLTDKNVGRQKVTGKIKLPADVVLSGVGNDNYLYVSIGNYDPNTGYTYYGIDMYLYDQVLDTNTGLYTFTTTFNNEQNIDVNLSLSLYGKLNGHFIDTNYQIGADLNDTNDHTIDGNEKLVSWALNTNLHQYVTFTSAVADFGTLDVDAYLAGAKLLGGTFTPPVSFPVGYDGNINRSINLDFNSYNDGYYFWFSNSLSIFNQTQLNANGGYDYEILIPQDIQGKIAENNLFVGIRLYFSDYNTGYYQTAYEYYTFGADMQVDATDHIYDGLCPSQTSVQPLSLDFSTTLPVLDINISDYILPATYKAELTLTLPQNTNLYNYASMAAFDMSCSPDYYYNYGSGVDNGNGTFTLTTEGLKEGHEYGFEVYYETFNNFDFSDYKSYSFSLNDDDGDFTNGGTFLAPLKWDYMTYTPIFDQTYTAIANDVVFSPIILQDYILQEKKDITPVIMYLLH